MTTSNPIKSFCDRVSNAYDAIADAGEHQARERGLEALAGQPGERVLEIGYGTGHSLVALAKAVGESGMVCGVDMLGGSLGWVERVHGTRRTVLTFFGIPLATLLLLAIGVTRPLAMLETHHGELLMHARDVGPSAGYYGCLGLAVSYLSDSPTRQNPTTHADASSSGTEHFPRAT